MGCSYGFMIGVDIEPPQPSGDPQFAKIKGTDIIFDWDKQYNCLLLADSPLIGEGRALWAHEYNEDEYCIGLVWDERNSISASEDVIADLKAFLLSEFGYTGNLRIYRYISY